jgi:CHAD domain-containing protein
MDTASPLPLSKRHAGNRQLLGAFVAEQLEVRLRKVAFELRNTRQTMDEERVHDLRVALRRLMESVRVAKGVLPEEGSREVLRDLRRIMKDAGHVRSFDIAAELLRGAGADGDAAVMKLLAERRVEAERKLYEHAQQAFRRNATLKWRTALLLGSGA